jgi:hypothetical protein
MLGRKIVFHLCKSGEYCLAVFGDGFLINGLCLAKRSIFTPSTTLRVEAAPLLKMVSSTPRTPFNRTTFCCGW